MKHGIGRPSQIPGRPVCVSEAEFTPNKRESGIPAINTIWLYIGRHFKIMKSYSVNCGYNSISLIRGKRAPTSVQFNQVSEMDVSHLWILQVVQLIITVTEIRPSDKFDNPNLTIPWVPMTTVNICLHLCQGPAFGCFVPI